jgi:murein DD-endopeptidase MepM/ murein hydrolase activator NlpD
MALFLVVGLLAIGLAAMGNSAPGEHGVWGGPIGKSRDAIAELAMLSSQSLIANADTADSAIPANSQESSENAMLDDQGSGIVAIGGASHYIVAKGDTLSEIAVRSGISTQTILSANPGLSSRTLREGESINILPVSGIIYKTRSGDTPEVISATYHLTIAQLREFNRGVNFNELSPDTALIIPGGKPSDSAFLSDIGGLPMLRGYFRLPAEGFNWGVLHNYNAVDIGNACGTKVSSAAEGLVVPDDSLGDGSTGWNGGYGHFVLVEHPNGTKTRYAHLDQVLVHIGDYVKQGEELGTMGNTGNVHGPTGCHLHFEVYAAGNPFEK